MLYCTYDMLNLFRALLCPSSGARDYVCVINAYGVQCLVTGCRGSGAGQQAVSPGEGCCTTCSIPFPGHVEYIISAIKHSVISSWFLLLYAYAVLYQVC